MLLRTKRQLETMWEVRTGINGCPVYRCPSLNITQVSQERYMLSCYAW